MPESKGWHLHEGEEMTGSWMDPPSASFLIAALTAVWRTLPAYRASHFVLCPPLAVFTDLVPKPLSK